MKVTVKTTMKKRSTEDEVQLALSWLKGKSSVARLVLCRLVIPMLWPFNGWMQKLGAYARVPAEMM